MRFKPKFSHRLRRFGSWLKQVILLGRADWRKASDDANPPRLTRKEREELQPHFDVIAIRPRAVSTSERAPGLAAPVPPPDLVELPAAPPMMDPPNPAPTTPATRQFRRRRPHSHSRQIAINPLAAFSPEKLPASKLERLVERFFGRRD